jgi:hypothetical protein
MNEDDEQEIAFLINLMCIVTFATAILAPNMLLRVMYCMLMFNIFITFWIYKPDNTLPWFGAWIASMGLALALFIIGFSYILTIRRM